MTQPAKPISLSDTEQSAEAATTERASKSVSIPGGGGKASVPSIIHELYSAPTLYPGEDPALFERLFEDLAHALAPAGLIQWLLVAELWTVILDEGRYRKMLAMIMSPQELIEPEVSEQENHNPILKTKREQSTIVGTELTPWKQKNKIEYGQKSSRKFGLNANGSVLLQKPMLLSLSVERPFLIFRITPERLRG